MTSAIMLAKVRTLLDESSASFWTDAETYASLAHGQIAVIENVMAVYKKRYTVNPETELPEELRTLLQFDSAGISASQINVPSGFFWLVSARWDHDASGDENACRIVNMDRQYLHEQDNAYLAASGDDPIAYVAPEESAGTQSINFRPVYSTNGTYAIYYLAYPTAIASGQEPTIPERSHNAIVEYATCDLLMKDQRPQEAQIHYNKYLQEIKSILGL